MSTTSSQGRGGRSTGSGRRNGVKRESTARAAAGNVPYKESPAAYTFIRRPRCWRLLLLLLLSGRDQSLSLRNYGSGDPSADCHCSDSGEGRLSLVMHDCRAGMAVSETPSPAPFPTKGGFLRTTPTISVFSKIAAMLVACLRYFERPTASPRETSSIVCASIALFIDKRVLFSALFSYWESSSRQGEASAEKVASHCVPIMRD
ncbi:hypothetical protein MRX96_045313 [Rhipicephalus microplus]